MIKKGRMTSYSEEPPMRIQVTSPPTSLSTDIGKKMVGTIFTDAYDGVWPGTFFVPVENLLRRMPAFEQCREFSPLMEGIYLSTEACTVLRLASR